jgi:hypothetical protein
MEYGRWLRLLIAGTAFAAMVAAVGLPIPGADRLGLSGTAAAQGIDIDSFYDELDPYGQWVWNPRFGYVWLPDRVSENWRPYTVGHWIYTDEYGWYWDSYEPFAWAVYHYGRWGYDPDYGWFWVPGDTWAPAWVQWRYGDDYVGWAPIGPRRGGYAYGAPDSYDPAIAESWVFVQPRYLTSRSIYRYALPAAELGVAFLGAPNVYRPEFRGGGVFNFGVPRDRMMRITKQPIIVQKIFKVDRKGGRYGKFEGHEGGIQVFAPGFEKGAKPNRGPKKFADSPFDLKSKTKLKDTFKGQPPKGWGPGAAEVEPVAKEVGPEGFKKKHGPGGFEPRDNAKGEPGEADKHGGPDDQGGRNKGNEAEGHGGPKGPGGPGGAGGFGPKAAPVIGDTGDNGKGKKTHGGEQNEGDKGPNVGDQGAPGKAVLGKPLPEDQAKGEKPQGGPGGPGAFGPKAAPVIGDTGDNGKGKKKKHGGEQNEGDNGQGPGNQGGGDHGADQGGKRHGPPPGVFGSGGGGSPDDGQGKSKFKGPGGPVGPGGPGGPGGQAQGGGDEGHGKGGDKKNKEDKCKKHPEQPECQNPN